MRRTIDQFMWSFQHMFRPRLERSARTVLLELGLETTPTAYLIGVQSTDADRHRICIEPEDGPLVQADFDGIFDRAEELYGLDPTSEMFFGSPEHGEARRRGAQERAMSQAVCEAITAKYDGRVACFATYPARVDVYAVYPVVVFPVEAMDTVPRLSRETGDDPDRPVDQSIVEAALDELLRHATMDMYLPDAGRALEPSVSTAEVLRRALERLATAVSLLSGNDFGGQVSNALNRLSTMRYEQRVGIGRLLLVQRSTPGVVVDLEFSEPIPLRETRTLRKLLEMSSRDGPALLTDGDDAYGLGRLDSAYDPGSERAFEILVLGDGTWEIHHADTVLVTVKYGSPQLPQKRLERDRFADTAARVLGPGSDVDALWSLALGASDAAHGTMIVISSIASTEAERLTKQAIRAKPAALAPDVLQTVTQIDGAVLVDPEALCHGLGVILDGTAGDEGDRSRGARYNSAIKYLGSQNPSTATVIVIVSEDGMINVLPDLRPRISRAKVAAALSDLREAASIDPPHGERFHKALRRVEAVGFYLSVDECDEVNRLHAEHWERRKAGGDMIWMSPGAGLQPHPDMDDSFFSD